MERYWSGGISPVEVKPNVDIFVDGEQILIGAHDGEVGVLVEVDENQVMTIVNMLKEALVRQKLWRLIGQAGNEPE